MIVTRYIFDCPEFSLSLVVNANVDIVIFCEKNLIIIIVRVNFFWQTWNGILVKNYEVAIRFLFDQYM